MRKRVKRFVFTSSIAVYGAAQNPMTESTTPMPEDPYGVAKYACEMDLRAAHEMFGLNYTIFRPHNVYGEHQNIGDRYRNVIGIFMNQIMQGQPMTIFGDGLQTRAFTHIDDVAPLIARCVDVPEASNQIFNIGAETPTTVRELAAGRGKGAWRRAENPLSSTPARKWCMRFPAATHCSGCSAGRTTFHWKRESSGWRPGPRSTALAQPGRSPALKF